MSVLGGMMCVGNVGGKRVRHAILDENVQALLDGKPGVEDDEAKTQGENVVTSADLEEVANGTLFDAALVKIWI
jgi:hypothetical protein